MLASESIILICVYLKTSGFNVPTHDMLTSFQKSRRNLYKPKKMLRIYLSIANSFII